LLVAQLASTVRPGGRVTTVTENPALTAQVAA
jgi:hypothetical protein